MSTPQGAVGSRFGVGESVDAAHAGLTDVLLLAPMSLAMCLCLAAWQCMRGSRWPALGVHSRPLSRWGLHSAGTRSGRQGLLLDGGAAELSEIAAAGCGGPAAAGFFLLPGTPWAQVRLEIPHGVGGPSPGPSSVWWPQRHLRRYDVTPDNTCIICAGRPILNPLWPCGHAAVCEGCTSRLSLCPVCRVPLEACL